MDGSPSYGWSQRAHHMGQLARGDQRWEVFLEMVPDGDARTLRGRIHFVSGDRHRESAWVFLEWNERDLKERFNDFSATELWSLLESLGP